MWPDSIDAAVFARQEVAGALDLRILEHASEDLELGAAQTRAVRGRFADGAVMLNEQKATGVLRDDLGHVALDTALVCQGLESRFEGSSFLHDRFVLGRLFVRTIGNDCRQRFFAEDPADSLDQVHGELAVTVRKEVVREIAQRPLFGWSPAAASRLRRLVNQTCGLESEEMLANRDVGQSEASRQARYG
jgi:hypothetical protein